MIDTAAALTGVAAALKSTGWKPVPRDGEED